MLGGFFSIKQSIFHTGAFQSEFLINLLKIEIVTLDLYLLCRHLSMPRGRGGSLVIFSELIVLYLKCFSFSMKTSELGKFADNVPAM